MLAKAEVSYTTRMNEVSQQMISDLEKVDFTGADGIPAPPTSAPPGPPIDDMNWSVSNPLDSRPQYTMYKKEDLRMPSATAICCTGTVQ